MSESTALAIPGDDGDDRRKPVSDQSYDVELDAHQGPQPPQLVDAPPLPGSRLPVIPGHLRTRAGLVKAARRRADLYAFRTQYHGIRSPRYLLLALAWAVVGVIRITAKLIRWWHVLEQHSLRSEAIIAGDDKAWSRLSREAREMRAIRGGILGGGALVLVIGAALLVKFGQWWAYALVIAVALPFLARAGRPADRRIITSATVTGRFRRLNADIVLRAYYSAKLGDPDKPDQKVTFGSPMRRDGDGSGVHVDLPYGKTLKDATDSKDRVASGLDVQESQVFMHRDPTSTRRHYLWVADRDPLAVPVGPTPLLACRPTDIWRRAPLGLDERGQLTQFSLMWHSVLVGGMPRQGKSWTSRLLALFAALDPWARLHVFDAGGKPDWRKFALVADSCGFGLTPTRAGKPPEILLNTLMELRKDVEERYERLSSLPTSVCPQGKLTREIARDPSFGMPVRLLVLGEVQEYFLLGEISKAIAELLVYLVKVAPGAGVIVLSDTQRPSGVASGWMGTQFVNFRDQHQVRFALKTPSWGVSDLVLGDGAYSSGLDSSKLLEEYKGVGILRNAMNASPTVRCYYADDADAERMLMSARALRQRAGTLSGMALGEKPPEAAVSVLADVLAVLGDTPAMHWETLAPLLAQRFPDRHADATAESVSAQCRAAGVPPRQVKHLGRNLNGCRRQDVLNAAGAAGAA